MLVARADLRFLSAREQPKLLQLSARAEAGWLHLQAPDLAAIRIAEPQHADFLRVRIWDDTLDALPADASAADALSAWLGVDVSLVFMSDQVQRLTDPRYATAAGQSVSFADGYPLLLITNASLLELNRRLAENAQPDVSMARFRPNLVLDGALPPHAEDSWRHIQIGNAHFDLVKPCVRCVLTTIDPDSLTRDANNEPLRTLLSYRRGAKGVTFGMNLIPRQCGTLQLGDTLQLHD
jgi:uncharacterized protein